MKKFLSVVLALVMTMSLVTVSAGAKDFTDDSKITYDEAVDVMSAVKVIDGYTDGSFNPQNTLTRGAAAKIICNLILGPTTASALSADTAPFKDVPADHTFAGYIAYCAQQGIISGYADGAFRPAGTLTGYAFMKMLLGALGYDAKVEGYTGANWSIQVAKRALNLGLDNGLVGSFNGTKAVNREEACLFALNTLTSDMVQYDAKTSVTVGGAEVVIAGSKAEVIENNAKSESIENDDVLQFAEKYFADLKLNRSATDSFMRPANQWKLKAETVGTYAKAADLTYTAAVKSGTIYADLGLNEAIADDEVDLYVNGAAAPSMDLQKGNKTSIGKNGVLTEVFFNDDDNTAVITQVWTYFGEVAAAYEAKASKDAYIDIDAVSNTTHAKTTFETEAFEEGDAVLYTYSEKDDAVISVVAAEFVEGKVDEVVNKTNDQDNSSLTVDGTEYKASADMLVGLLNSLDIDCDYTVYLDEYGYAIHASEDEYVSEDYALVYDIRSATVNTGSNNAWTSNDNEAVLVFADGKTKIVELAKDYLGKNLVAAKDIVTFKVNDNGEYVLKAVDQSKQIDTDKDTGFLMENGVAKVQYNVSGKAAASYTNSKSVVVIQDKDETFAWDSYTGTKNTPSVNDGTAKEDAQAYIYCKSGNMVTVMFVVPNSNSIVNDDNDQLLFVAGGSVSDLIHNRVGDYYTYNAVLDGQVTTIKVDASVEGASTLNGFYDKHTMDGQLIDSISAKGSYVGTGIAKTSEDYTITITGGTNADTWTVDEDAEIYVIDEDHEITAISYGQIKRDNDDTIYYNVTNGMVDYLVIEKEDTTTLPPVNTTGVVNGIALANTGIVTVTTSANVTVDTTAQVTLAQLRDTGYVTIGTYTVTIAAGSNSGTLDLSGDMQQGELYQITCNGYTDREVKV